MGSWCRLEESGFAVHLAATSVGVCRVDVSLARSSGGKAGTRRFVQGLRRDFGHAEWREDPRHPVVTLGSRQVREYLRGKRRELDAPLDVKGTAFQRAVWNAARSIPYGEAQSYQQVAAAIGRPKAMRAVGNAMNLCEASLFIPAHRVVGAGGQLGGWGKDDRVKIALLKLEGCRTVRGIDVRP